jgi:hypothetical protein
MDLRWRPIGQALMWPFTVVEREVACEARFQRWDAGIVGQVHVFLRDRPPSPFDKDMIQCAAPAIHADRDPRPPPAPSGW